MDLKFFLGIAVAVAVIFFAAAFYSALFKNPAVSQDRDTLYQVSTIDALMQGSFDGTEPVGTTLKHGDFGIGTFDGLDGEMIVLDGKIYQAKADGRVYAVPDSATTPFATVTYFSTDIVDTTDRRMNYSELSSALAKKLPTRNMVYAVKVHGTFPVMKVRAIPKQQEPYPMLSNASQSQSVYTYTNATGTIVGFYTPVLFEGLNVPGYHLHFISDDRNTGWHILDMTADAGTTVEYDITQGFAMTLPTSGTFTGVDLSQNLSAALAKVER
jgi:acetolactate decarboxylase